MFKLDFDFPPSKAKITLDDKVYLSGSCFSDEIGGKLSIYKFESLSNPFGTLYNPISIFKSISGSLNKENTIESGGVFYHWDCHGKISGLSNGEVEKQVEITQVSSTNFLSSATVIILTLGTSYVYQHRSTNEIVANCHKVPSKEFTKQLLTKEEIVQSFSDLYSNLNSNLKIVLTVSPVRHIRDGLVENNLSKARLIESVYEIVQAHENVSYFPSYEIMNDELRDYRFFAQDMIHPSEQAVDYIWKKFSDHFFDQKTKTFIDDWNKVLSALNHAPFQPKSKEHQRFLKKTMSTLENLKDQIDVSNELKAIQKQIL